jgi:hypothetical protein|tara:strand:+ start:169 stop:504 length:336 start_codon:yes stop_codon:yes gene_type:complete
MGNVVEFPTEARGEVMFNNLKTQVENLEERYQVLDAMHAEMNSLEHELKTLEKDYDVALRAYGQVVGDNNIEVGFFEYSTLSILEVDADKDEITIRWGNSDTHVIGELSED